VEEEEIEYHRQEYELDKAPSLLQEGTKEEEEVERQLCQEESCIEWTKQRMRERNVMVVGVKER
jgi:hypothetical protein